jgi:DNA-binding IclR family transcriptional regulator
MHLERLILILETVAQAGRAMTVTEIGAATHLPKASTYRLVRDLVDTGLLEPRSKGAFALGARLRRMVRQDLGEQHIVDCARPLMRQAADSHGAAFFMARLRGHGVEIIHVETPRDERVSYLHPGLGYRPLHACSCAKAIAAFSNEPMIRTALEGKLRAYTDYTHTDMAELEVEFSAIRHRGFAECVQEIEVGICSVAAPVHQRELGAIMSLGATGSTRLFTEDYRSTLGQSLIDMAGAFAAQLEETAPPSAIPDVQAG